MLFVWVILPILLVLVTVGYLFWKVSAAVRFWAEKSSRKKQRLLTAGICIILVLPAVGSPVLWFVVLMHLAVLLLLSDAITWIAGKIRKKGFSGFWKGLYRSGVPAILLTALILGYGYYNIQHIVRTEYSVLTEKEIREEGYTVVFLSDLHYGTVLDKEQLQKAVDSIEKEKPDVVILGGDIVDESTTLEEMEEAFSVLGGISSQYGIYFVYGNHDRSNYSASPNYSEQQLADAIKQAGIQTLEDTVCEINGEIVLIGRGDKGDGKTGRKSVSQLVEGLDDGKVWILVDHRPADYEAAEKSGCEMILSGHTHAGQIWPIGILSGIAQMDEMNYGYREQGNLTAIVSSGIAGWGLPIRTEGHSEYVVISLSK